MTAEKPFKKKQKFLFRKFQIFTIVGDMQDELTYQHYPISIIVITKPILLSECVLILPRVYLTRRI
jgi:hypothetical protein